MKYTRAELIKICEKAFVPQKKWMDRDSADSQIQLGACYALLKAGCYFEIQTKGNCKTDSKTIWIQFWVHDFQYFEYGADSFKKDGNEDGDYHFYLPTMNRLKDRKGGDWY